MNTRGNSDANDDIRQNDQPSNNLPPSAGGAGSAGSPSSADAALAAGQSDQSSAATAEQAMAIADAEENLRYGRIMGNGMRVIFWLMIIVFAVYIGGLVPGRISFKNLPQYWGLPASQYVEQTGMPTGWSWADQLHYSDVMTYIPAVLLAGLSMVCVAAIMPIYARRGERAMVVILLLQLLVMLSAAVPWSLLSR